MVVIAVKIAIVLAILALITVGIWLLVRRFQK